jgi:chromate transporter
VSLGYITYGVPGAALALLAVSIPPLLVLGIASVYARIEHRRWVAGLMRGVSLAVVGILLTVCWTILHGAGVEWSGWIIAVAAFALAISRRVPLIVILGLAGLAGYALYR